MKKIITFLIAILFTGTLFGQYASQGYRYPVQYGMPTPGTVTGGVIYLKGLTSGRVKLMAPAIAGAATDVTLPSTSGVLATTQNISDSLAATTTIDTTFIYLEMDTLQSNIDLKVSISDTATMLANYALTSEVGTGDLSASDTASMLTPYARKANPVLTGVIKISTTDTLATQAYARGYGGIGTLNASDTTAMLAPYINRADTATMLSPYSLTSEVRAIVADSLSGRLDGAETAISLQDSTGNAPGNYITRQDLLVEGDLHVNISDTATMLTPYINRADTSTMLTPYINRADTATMLANYAKTSEIGGVGVYVAIEDSTGNAAGNYMSLKRTQDNAKMLADTALFFAPVIGLGNAGDTIAFSLSDVIWGAKWEGSHNLVITKVTGVVYGTSPDIDIAVLHDTNFRDATPTEVLSADLTITSTTTGSEATSFASATIASGSWIWIRVDQQTAQPTQCIINIYGHLTE